MRPQKDFRTSRTNMMRVVVRGPLLEVRIMRTVVYWGLFGGPRVYGNSNLKTFSEVPG